jgi:flagellar hook assembly protein FlgD
LSLASGPNPFREGTRLTLTLPHASQVELGVYDASGRLVRRIQEGRLEPGTWGFAWDGRDAHEGVVRAGVYFVRARVDGSVIRTKLVRVP